MLHKCKTRLAAGELVEMGGVEPPSNESSEALLQDIARFRS